MAVPWLALALGGCATLGERGSGLSVQDRDTRLQIFLDEAGFAPGKLDGGIGEFGRKALSRYGQANDLGKLDPSSPGFERLVPVRTISPIYTTYTIRPEDARWIGPLPSDRNAQADLPALLYTSYLEFVAERYHSDRRLIRKLNPALGNLKIGDTVKVPNVTPFQIETLEQKGFLIPPKPEFKSRVIRIDTRERMLGLYEGNRILASFPITPGSSRLPAPKGKWKIVNMASMPYFRYDDKMLNEGVRSDDFVMLPPGPNCPVGVIWMGLSKSGVGLHGTNNPETIGRAASHGCIRLSNWDAVRLSKMVTQGMTVQID